MKKNHLSLLARIVLGYVIASGAFAHHEPDGNFDAATSAIRLNNGTGSANQWNGVGRLFAKANHSYCTASLIDTRGNPANDDRAYVLTSQRCLKSSGLKPPALPLEGTAALEGHMLFNRFADTPEHARHYALRRQVWGSGSAFDLAIIELDASLTQLLGEGINPLRIARAAPRPGSPLRLLGVPEYHGLHSSSCQLQAQVDVLEQPQLWRGMLKHDCAGGAPGTLGGPLLDRNSNEIVGVSSIGTHELPEQRRCLPGYPCEIAGTRLAWSPQTRYASDTSVLQGCLPEIDAPSCLLNMPTQVTFTSAAPGEEIFVASSKADTVRYWNPRLSVQRPFLRYKAVAKASLCESPDHYSNAVSARDVELSLSLGPKAGVYLFCVVGVDSMGERPNQALMKGARTYAIELEAPRKARAPDLTITPGRFEYLVEWHRSTPFFERYRFKYGPLPSTHCNDDKGYQEIPAWIEVKREYREEMAAFNQVKDHPSNPNMILVHFTWADLNDVFRKSFKIDTQSHRLCTQVHDQKDRKAVRSDILIPR